MNKIDLKFNELKEKNKKALIPFIAVGNKSLAETIEIVKVLEMAGADIVELGIPYSDPLADGPVIQNAYSTALLAGVKVNEMVKTIKEITLKVTIPIIVMVYYNVIYCKGIENFIEALNNAGVSGLIVPDIPLEERAELNKVCENKNLALIPLVAPTSQDRIKKITRNCNGFVYCISHAGTTGEQKEISGNIKEYLSEVRSSTEAPICVGFGISSLEQAKSVAKHCDGIIIGSALVKIISSSKEFQERKQQVFQFIKKIKDNI